MEPLHARMITQTWTTPKRRNAIRTPPIPKFAGVNACNELMDATYCSTVIREEIQAAARVPLIDHHPRQG
jgi:hypothetical protein